MGFKKNKTKKRASTKSNRLKNYNDVKGYTKKAEYRTKKQYYVYVLECENNAFYVGIAFDIEKRFEQHLGGNAAKFTKENYPTKIVETMPTHTIEMGLACVFENYKVCEYRRKYPNHKIGGGSRKLSTDRYK